MARLEGTVAVVTGASRGVGRGVALGLGEAGATVYVTGRTVAVGDTVDGLGGTIVETAEAVTALGGVGIPVRCDHLEDVQVEALFDRVHREQGCLDLLVNNAWGGYQHMVEEIEGERMFTFERPFWEQPRWRWRAMFDAGVRAHFVASQLAAPLMLEQRRGLIATTSYWAAQKYMGNLIYGVAKTADDRMVADMARELRPHGVAAVSLYPGLVRTEGVMRSAEYFDLSNSESPQFIGRVVAALAADPKVMRYSGRVLVTAELARAYGVRDLDGSQPRPLTLEEA